MMKLQGMTKFKQGLEFGLKSSRLHACWVQQRNWVLIIIGIATLALEIWMIVEALLLWPKVRGVLEEQLPGAVQTAQVGGMNC